MIGTPVATLPDASGKASVSRLADLGSKPDLLVRGEREGGRECPRSSHTGDSMIGTPVATLPDASGKASVSRLADLGSKPDLLVRGGGWGGGGSVQGRVIPATP